MRRVTRLLIFGTVTAGVVLGFSPVTAQAAPGVSLNKTSVNAAPDFASERYADAWDFSNPQDMSVVPLKVGSKVSGMNYQNNEYHAYVNPGGNLNLVQTGPGQLPYGRDGQVIPIDANKYTRFAVRMWADKDDVAQLWWTSCPEARTECYGAAQFAVHQGWNIYDIALQKLSVTAQNWTGSMMGIRIDPLASKGGNVALDWARIYQPQAANAVTVTAQPGASIVVDYDTAVNGNEATLRNDNGTVKTDAYGKATIDASLLPQGSWQIAARNQSGNTVYGSSPLNVLGAPMPVVLDPDVTGGADVHQILGGSAWDFNETSDVTGVYNVSGGVGNGVYNGRNAKPDPGDNQINLAMPGSIDGNQFHRLTFKVSYDGGWSLAGSPGGGMLARLLWTTPGNGVPQDSNDIVIVPGSQTVTIDMTGNPNVVIDEASRTREGWINQYIQSVRFDPNEDPSTDRTWQVDDIRLAQDDAGNGAFNVSFQDNNWAPGTTADIYVDRGGMGLNRTGLASGIPVNQGVNTYNWNLGGLPAGKYWVLVALNRGGVSASAFSTGPVQMTSGAAQPPTPPPAPPQPFGSIDSVSQVGADGVRIQGWAIDPSFGGGSSPVHLYVDGRGQPLTADRPRGDVGAAFGQGANHGFDYTMTGVGAGNHSVCAYAYRPSGSKQLSCKPFYLSGDTTGNLDEVVVISGGVRVSGWALDRSTASSIGVHVYVDGYFAGGGGASNGRGDIGAAYPAYGPQHGFSFGVPVGTGSHTICAYGLDLVAPGANSSLGCRVVNVSASPFGSLDQAQRSGTNLTVSGWALDPRSIAPTAVHVYVDGVGRAVLSTNSYRGDVVAAFPNLSSPSQGFSTSIQVSNASHEVCAYAIGAAANALIGCKRV